MKSTLPLNLSAIIFNFSREAVTSLTKVLGAYRTLGEGSLAGDDLAVALAGVREEERKNELDYLLGEIPQTFERNHEWAPTRHSDHSITQRICSSQQRLKATGRFEPSDRNHDCRVATMNGNTWRIS